MIGNRSSRRATPSSSYSPRSGAEVLGRQDIGVHDDFFGLGGNSLNATQAVARLRTVLGRDVPLRCTVYRADHCRHGRRPWSGRGGWRRTGPIRCTRSARAEGPLSYSQERMWFLQQLDPASTAYNMVVAASLRAHWIARRSWLPSPTSSRGMRSSGRRSRRLQASRASGRQRSRPLRCWSGIFEICRLGSGCRRQRPWPPTRASAVRPERGPLLRAQLIQVADDEHILVLTLHHIAGDLGPSACWAANWPGSTTPGSVGMRRRCRRSISSMQTSPPGTVRGAPAPGSRSSSRSGRRACRARARRIAGRPAATRLHVLRGPARGARYCLPPSRTGSGR